MADVATPLHIVVHKEKFEWIVECEETFRNLKVLLSRAAVVQLPDWLKDFHIFVDASNIAIGSAYS